MATLPDRLGYMALRAVEGIVSAGAWERRISLGQVLGRCWHAADARHRRVARANIQAAFPDWTQPQVSALVRANFEHLAITAAEFLGLSAENSESILERSDFLGLEYLEEARGQGRGVFLLTAHQGNWEVAGFALAALGYPCFAVARRIKNPLVDQRVTEIRELSGGKLIGHRDAVRPVMKALRDGGLVALLMDQRALAREGRRSQFFGRAVSTNQGLAVLALKTGAPVVPIFGRRIGSRHRMHFGPQIAPPLEGDRESRIDAFTRAIDATIEAEVRACPEQWFWIHRRWHLPRELQK